eukprot:2391878-Alexandrium_andersonii.AAC.1
MSRRAERGARRNCRRASTSEVPKDRRKRDCTLSIGCRAGVDAWASAAVRHSIKDRMWHLNSSTSSASVWNRR